MRNWFILFATSFTITTLVLSVITWLIPDMTQFDNRYVVLVAITSAVLSIFMHVFNQLAIENIFLNIVIDIVFIFTVVFVTGIIIQLYKVTLGNFLLILFLVIFIYTVITLIYLFILKIETENMNEKIANWRDKHVDSEKPK
ncbi:MAG TPA: hypothetical protein VK067_05385 [Pseudogracilibacillus sp.]|nr:hypothetical protein [Pseudogracilibacillus sp.]